MKTIPLTQGFVALVDDADYPRVSARSWYYNEGYALRTEAGRKIYLHHVVLGYSGPDEIDHVNRDCLDNRRENLRVATRSQNCANRAKFRGTTSRFKGVNWHAATQRWRARIRHDNVETHLGTYRNEVAAARAYDKAAKELHGEFARLNFPEET